MVTRKRIRRLERYYTGSILPGLDTYFGDRKKGNRKTGNILLSWRLDRCSEAGKILCRLESYSGYWADINEAILWKTERVLETGNLLWRLKGILDSLATDRYMGTKQDFIELEWYYGIYCRDSKVVDVRRSCLTTSRVPSPVQEPESTFFPVTNSLKMSFGPS